MQRFFQSSIALFLSVFLAVSPAIAQTDPSAAPLSKAPIAGDQSGTATLPPHVPVPHTLLDGTPVKLRLAQNLTSATAKAGDTVAFEVTEDVLVDGIVVLPKGAAALANVTDASPKRSMGRGGKLDVSVDSARLADGEKVQLRATQDNKGGGHVGAMTGAMVATAVVFFPAAPLFLFIHGKDVTIPQGTEVTAFVEGDMKLEMAKFQPVAPATDIPTAAANSGSASANGTMIDASIPNCDIEVDGAFVGSTPSTLTLTPGKHDIVVKKAGYDDWKRTINVTGGAVHVSAEMVKTQTVAAGTGQ